MIMTKEFTDWFRGASKEAQESMYNFAIYSLCGLKLRDRVKVAYEIIRGKAYCVKISSNQINEL